MNITHTNNSHSGVLRKLPVTLAALLALFVMGCGPDSDDGTAITELTLPTDLILRLRCADVGIYLETCVLQDEENPYRNVIVGQFDENNPDAPIGVLELLNEIPEGPMGAKARFYLRATSLAQRATGENQYFTARALHELWTAQEAIGIGDPVIQEQAKKAYRAVLDYFFGSATFFSTCDFAPCPPNPELIYSVIVSDLVGKDLYAPVAPTFGPLWPGDPASLDGFRALEAMADWGFTYDIDNDLVFVNM